VVVWIGYLQWKRANGFFDVQEPILRNLWLAGNGPPEMPLEKRTLTNLYNKRPDWLDQAHKRLDAAVLDAYGWPHDLSDDEILARLLALNLERAARQGQVPAAEGQADEEE
jgi:hypothetical protein